jgi:rfaE bifunctional protein nucleotidyltransferase chain/domain/rfaE bifunctional protein kinase chain/domain
MSVLVLGDVLLDVDMRGTSGRLSPDAPVPVVDVDGSTSRAGGAGLAATLLARDGIDVVLVAALSDDHRANTVRAGLPGVRVVAGPSHAPTPTKTRVSAVGHAIVRFDEGCGPAPEPGITDEMLVEIAEADAVLVSDYGRGVAAHPRIRAALEQRVGRIPIVWDPHPRGAVPIPGVTLATPNLAEALAAAGTAGSGVDAAATAGERLRERWACEAVAVTLGATGALLVTADRQPALAPAPAASATDPCGAGDRLATAALVALVGGADLPTALETGVRAASAFLEAGGVASIESDAAREPIALPGAPDAARIARRVRAAGGTVVATGGCFDLLHAGHARTLLAARSLGDCLIVCINSDDSVRRLKGPERPIMTEADRVDLLASLECVDAVVVFEEDSPESVLDRLRPDIWVKGGDYAARDLPETALVESWGGRVVTVPYHPGRSTTRLAGALARVG